MLQPVTLIRRRTEEELSEEERELINGGKAYLFDF